MQTLSYILHRFSPLDAYHMAQCRRWARRQNARVEALARFIMQDGTSEIDAYALACNLLG